MKRELDINADVGESYGNFSIGNDSVILPMLSSCNIACGMHGGDPLTIKRTIDMALQNGVKVGAHPSYPDLQGFGRRSMKMATDELEASIVYQVSALKGMVEAAGGTLHHVKPHGALNNDMVKSTEIMDIIIKATAKVDPDLKLFIPYQKGLRKQKNFVWEVFADRTYENDLSLTPRSMPGSVLGNDTRLEEHLQNLIRHGYVSTPSGHVLIEAETVCVHGDNPDVEQILGLIHKLLQQ